MPSSSTSSSRPSACPSSRNGRASSRGNSGLATALAAVPGGRDLWRVAIIATGAAAILAPVALVVYQSFLSAPFFSARARFSLDGYAFVLADEDFWVAGLNSVILAASMVAIAVPVGAALAYLVVRTDLPARRALETLVLVPLFVSPMVLAFGYVVSLGPVGFLTTAYESLLGAAPWNIYSMLATALIVALTHVPHVYLYVAAALRLVPSDSEEAARVAGAGPGRTALTVTLPMVLPSIGVGAVLVFFLGFELFGLPYVLGDPEGRLVLSTYLYKLTTRLGTPSYQLMAVVVVAIMLVTLPLVAIQRLMVAQVQRYATLRGKAARPRLLLLGRWRFLALAAILLWLVAVVAVPLAGITLRSFVSSWGVGVRLRDVLTLDNYAALDNVRGVGRSIVNTLLIAVFGAALSVAAYGAFALATHRWRTGPAAAEAVPQHASQHLARLYAGLDAVRAEARLERHGSDRAGARGRRQGRGRGAGEGG